MSLTIVKNRVQVRVCTKIIELLYFLGRDRKMENKFYKILLVLPLWLLFAVPAWSYVVTIQVTGAVDSVTTDGGYALDGSVTAGTTMTGFCTYHSDTPDMDSDEYDGLYDLISVSMTIGNYIFNDNPFSYFTPKFEIGGPADCREYKVYSPRSSFDGTITVNGSPKTYDDLIWEVSYLTLMRLQHFDIHQLSDDSLPVSSFPDISYFNRDRRFGVHFRKSYVNPEDGYFSIGGNITSVTLIPEPATILLLSLGGLLLRKG